MKFRISAAFAGLFLTLGIFSARAQTLFEKVYGGSYTETANSVISTSDGGYLLAGNTYSYGASTPANCNMYLVKTDGAGAQEWQKNFGGAGDDKAYKAIEVPNGYVICGDGINPGTGNYDIFVVKTDLSGNTVWSHYFDGGINSTDLAIDALALGGGNILIAGASDTSGTSFDALLMKISASGSLIWQHHLGGAGVQLGKGVRKTADGGFLLCGASNTAGVYYDMYAAKTDSNGHEIWHHTYGGAFSDYAEDVVQLADGSYMLAGSEHNYNDSSQAYMLHLNSAGTLLWSRQVGRRMGDEVYSIDQHPGGFVLTGYTQSEWKGSQVLLIKTDNNGDTLLTKEYGGDFDDAGNWILSRPSGYVMAGISGGFGLPEQQMYLISTDTLGNIPCPAHPTFGLNPTPACAGSLIQLVNNTVSSVPVIWKINGTTVSSLPSPYHTFSAAGNYTVTLHTCAADHDSTLVIQPKPGAAFTFVANDTNVQFTMNAGVNPTHYFWDFGDGSNEDSTHLNPLHAYAHLGQYWITLSTENASGCDSTLIIQINIVPNGIEPGASRADAWMVQNPARQELRAWFAGTAQRTLRLCDLSGRVLLQQTFDDPSTTADISAYPDGLYLVQVQQQGENTVSRKLLIQH